MLIDHAISAMPVVNEHGEVIGIVSEGGDLVPLETVPDPRSKASLVPARTGRIRTTVAEVMTSRVQTATEDTDVAAIALLMLRAHVKPIPIMRQSRLVGIVSRHDLLQLLARNDRDVEQEARERIARDGDLLPGISVIVGDGIAHLSGNADPTVRRLAATILRDVPGVLDAMPWSSYLRPRLPCRRA